MWRNRATSCQLWRVHCNPPPTPKPASGPQQGIVCPTDLRPPLYTTPKGASGPLGNKWSHWRPFCKCRKIKKGTVLLDQKGLGYKVHFHCNSTLGHWRWNMGELTSVQTERTQGCTLPARSYSGGFWWDSCVFGSYLNAVIVPRCKQLVAYTHAMSDWWIATDWQLLHTPNSSSL